MPLHERDTVRLQLEDCVFVGRDLTAPVPKYRFPSGRDGSEGGVPGGVGRADARRQLPAEPGHVLPDVGRARGLRPDGAVDRQEHDRQGRVPADRRDRSSAACTCWPTSGMHPRPPTPWAPRPSGPRKPACSRAWRPSGGGGPSGRPKASRRTSRTWCAARSRWCGTSSRATGTSRCARCRCPLAIT